MRIRIEEGWVSGDRCPADGYRVTLYIGKEWIMFREFSEGLNGEKRKQAESAGKKLARKIREALNDERNILA